MHWKNICEFHNNINRSSCVSLLFLVNKCAECSTEEKKKTEHLYVFTAEMTLCRFRVNYPETIMFSKKRDINSTIAVFSHRIPEHEKQQTWQNIKSNTVYVVFKT